MDTQEQRKVDEIKYYTLRQKWEYFLSTCLLFSLDFLSKIFLRKMIQGKKEVEKLTTFLICANHQTFIDAIWISSLLNKNQKKKLYILGAADLATDYGFMGRSLASNKKMISVQRKGNPIRALIQAKKILEKQNILLIHPEGTRSRSGKLNYFHQGASFISFKTKSPIIPIFIEGGFEIFGPHLKVPHFFTWEKLGSFLPSCKKIPILKSLPLLRRKRLTLIIGKEIKPENYESAEDLHKALVLWMQEQENFFIRSKKGR